MVHLVFSGNGKLQQILVVINDRTTAKIAFFLKKAVINIGEINYR